MTGGVDDLDKLIGDLIQIRNRIGELENKELLEQRNFWLKKFEKTLEKDK